MTRRRPPDGNLPSPTVLARELEALSLNAARILRGYHRLHRLGLEPVRGDDVHVSGSPNVHADGSVTGYPPELAIESAYHRSRRAYARRVVDDVRSAARTLDLIARGFEVHVGPGAGYRQPTAPSGGFLSPDELAESLANQARRLEAGIE